MSLLVSSVLPFRIVSVQPDLAADFGYSADELVGRSLSILRGPNSDTVGLSVAIKSTLLSKTTELPVIFYDRDGTLLRYHATLSAEPESDGTAKCCCISLDAGIKRAQTSEDRSVESADVFSALRAREPPRRTARVGSCRGPHNRHVGELLHAEATGPSQSAASRRQEEAILNLLLAEA